MFDFKNIPASLLSKLSESLYICNDFQKSIISSDNCSQHADKVKALFLKLREVEQAMITGHDRLPFAKASIVAESFLNVTDANIYKAIHKCLSDANDKHEPKTDINTKLLFSLVMSILNKFRADNEGLTKN